MPFQRVLCPLDGSELSERALPYAADLADRFDAHLILLRAYDGPERAARMIAMTTAAEPVGAIDARTVNAVEDAAEEAEGDVHAYLSAHAAHIRERGLTVDTLVVDGAAPEAILQEAQRGTDTVVAMCTHGCGGLGRLVFGSVAQEVLQRSEVPVLLLRVKERS